MTDEELIKLLREWSDGMSGGKQVAELVQAADRIEALTAENFKLAAGSCDVEGGKVGDEHGHFYCTLQAKIEALTAENERLLVSNEQWQVDYNEAVIDKLELETEIDRLREALKRIARYDVGLHNHIAIYDDIILKIALNSPYVAI